MSAPDTAASDRPSEDAGPGRREPESQSTPRDRPHATKNDLEGGEIQPEGSGGRPIPAMPANASGTDRVTTDDQDEGIDPTSMYDRRRAEDKDQPPSGQP